MPTADKVNWAQLRVGMLVIFALSLIGLMIFLLTGSTKLFHKQDAIITYMDDANAMGEGSAVRLNGIVVGKVKKIELSGESRPGRVIRFRMDIDRAMMPNIPVDSVATVSSENVLGTKFINIKRGTAKQSVVANQEIKGTSGSGLDDVISQSQSMLSQTEAILKRVDNIVAFVENGQGSIGKILKDEELYNRIIDIVGQVQRLATTLNTDKGTLGKLIYDDTLYNDVRSELKRVDGLVADLEQGKGTAGKFLKDPGVYDEAQKNLVELRRLLEDLNAGKGSAGRFLKKDELADQINTVVGKLNVTLDKVNSGQGTIGQLLVNQALYDNLNGTTSELHGLLKDFRANPRKFLRIKLSLF